MLGVLASVLLVLEKPTLKIGLLRIGAIWSFCRLYHFAFYLIERYLDPGCGFAGILCFARYCISKELRVRCFGIGIPSVAAQII